MRRPGLQASMEEGFVLFGRRGNGWRLFYLHLLGGFALLAGDNWLLIEICPIWAK